MAETTAEKGGKDEPVVVEFEENDKGNPRNFKSSRKWRINLTYAYSMAAGTFAIGSYTSGFRGMREEFGASTEILTLGQFTYLIGLGIGSLLWPSVGDLLSRKWTMTLTMAIFTAFSAGVALANSMATAIVCRFFAGLFSACAQTLGPGSVGAIYAPADLAVPFTIAATAPFLGPSLGPLVGGFVVQRTGNWRNINWVSCGFAGVMTLLTATVPEISPAIILRNRAKKLTKETGQAHVSKLDVGRVMSFEKQAKRSFGMPFIFLAREPIVLILSLYIAMLYGILNLFFAAFPYIYQRQRHWSLEIAGLPYIGLVVGLLLSIPAALVFNLPFKRHAKAGGQAPPEDRLYAAMTGAVLAPISLFWLGFTAAPGVPWPAPVVAGGIFAFAQIGLTMSALTYLTDVYKINVASSIQALNLFRFGVLGAVFPLFSTQMYDNLGAPAACSILAGILIVFLPAPFAFKRYGYKLRALSMYALAVPTQNITTLAVVR